MKTNEITLERIYKALANRRRLLILTTLKTRKRESVGEVAAAIKLSIKATSKHLGILYAAGFVEKEQESLVVFYSLRSDMSEAARSALTIL